MTPKPLKIAEIILLIAVVIGGGVWLMKKPTQVAQPSPTLTTTSNEAYTRCADFDRLKNGEVLDAVETSRFGFCLDIAKYPLKNIKITCSEGASIGYVSNWSLNGPDDYPIGYEAVGNGTCTWQNGDFKATINIRNS